MLLRLVVRASGVRSEKNLDSNANHWGSLEEPATNLGGFFLSHSNMGMPKEIKGVIFTEIIPQLIPEVSTANLVSLGAIVRKKGRSDFYLPLTDSLRKIQWVKAVRLEAANIEQDMEAQPRNDRQLPLWSDETFSSCD
jgi:hypothetical protein